MKKNLLIAAAVIISAAGMAQNNSAKYYQRSATKGGIENRTEEGFPSGNYKPMTGPITRRIAPKASAACGVKRFTSCVNVFAVGGGVTTYMQNCLSYNKDLNAILWTSRMSADWPVAGTGLTNTGLGAGSYGGAIQGTWLNLGTGLWDSTIIYRDSSLTVRGRFPSGTFFNPTGNTSISGAYVVGAGSWTSGSGWGGTWYSSRQTTGNYHAVNNTLEHKNYSTTGAPPFGNVGNSTANAGFLNVDMQQVGQSVWSCGALMSPALAGDVIGTVIGKGNYSGGAFTWTRDTVLPAFYNGSLGLLSNSEGARLAFDPSGQIGYLVFVGRLATTYNNSADSTMMPIVYKSTDAGATWVQVLAGYDWSVNHPELLKNVGLLRPTTPAHVVTPFLSHGMDVAVDVNGTLHFVTTLVDPYLHGNVVDSIQYNYSLNWDHINNHPIIWDLMTDGSCWKTLLVDSILSSYVGSDPTKDSTANFSAWQSPSGNPFIAYGAHLTVSRSSDGTKVFYGWGDTDPNITGTPYNNAPDMMVKGFDVNSENMTPLMNVTNGIGTCFFSYLSDVSYFDNANSNWVVPFVYAVGRTTVAPGVYKGGEPVDFYYGDCSAFANSAFNMPGNVNQCAVGIKTNSGLANSVQNYPNPFNHSTNIVVTLKESNTLDLKVIDALGNVVYSKKVNGKIGENTFVFDGSALNSGVYYYSITSGYEKVTKKMIIQK